MINSMTAFARHESTHDFGQLVWEIRSVNHRYLETNAKLPELFRSIEIPLRTLCRKKLSRGKVDYQLRYQLSHNNNNSLTINANLLSQLNEALQTVEKSVECQQPTSLQVLQWPGLLEQDSTDRDIFHEAALTSFEEALNSLETHRQSEGKALKSIIEERLNAINTITHDVEQRIPSILAAQQQKLRDRIDDLNLETNPDRLEQELVILATKMDVAEELDRLKTHVKEVQKCLKKGGSCGRRLDFLMQELNREANTLSSKSISSDSTQAAVELKVLIEQMREQIQNIE